jgi:hypothetical protein
MWDKAARTLSEVLQENSRRSDACSTERTITVPIGCTVFVQPPPFITDDQAARIQDLVNTLASCTTQPHQRIWVALNRQLGVPSYRRIPAFRFADAEGYLLNRIDAATGPAAELQRRLAHIRVIKQRELTLGNAVRAFLQGMGRRNLRECDLAELALVRQHVERLAS